MISNIEVSVIIPHFERAELIKETIESIKNQSYQNWECIIVDDGSTEESLYRIKNYIKNDSRIKLHYRPTHLPKGANCCRQYGLSLSKGNYIKWFDSDDIMDTFLLEKQVEIIRKGYDGVFCSCRIYNEDFTKLLKTGWRRKVYDISIIDEYLKGNLAWQTGTGLWNKDIFDYHPPFKHDIKNAQEWIFHFELICLGIKIAVLNEELVMIRAHQQSISYSNRDSEYFFNRFKARVFALSLVLKNRIEGKSYLLKSLVIQLWAYLRGKKITYFTKSIKFLFREVLNKKILIESRRRKMSIVELVK